jgi:hypothetical protein
MVDIQYKGEKTMDVFIGDTIPVILEDSDPRHRVPPIKKVPSRDRRRKRQDRRKGVREGVVVHLSGKNKEHRAGMTDRRKLTY